MKTLFKVMGILFVTAFFAMTSIVFSQIKISDSAPLMDYKMLATDGQQLSLEDIKSENGTLVIFSCNTCPFVVGQKDGSFPGWERDYNTIYEKAKKLGVGMVLVNSNEANRTPENDVDGLEAMRQRANDYKYTMPYVIDEKHQLADALGAKTTPHVYLFDKDDKLVYVGSIDNTWDPKRKKDVYYLQEAFDKLGGKIKTQESQPRGCSIKRITI